MQSIPIYLYHNTTDVILDLDPTTLGVNRVMYQHDLKIQKGIKNKVRIQFKNSDQKRLPLSNTSTYVFSMFNVSDQRLLIEKNLNILDNGNTLALRGLAELTLNESDTVDLDTASYQYTVKYRDPSDDTYQHAYADTYYGVKGTIQLLQDAYPKLQPSQEIVSFNKHLNTTSMKFEHSSGGVYAYPEYNSNTALHTMVMYMTRFKGTVHVQASLDNTSTGNYSTIRTLTYNSFTGVDYVNFNGVYSYVRAYYIPATAPAESGNDNTAYYGSFDKILYRC